jgi:hypothetical protein
MALNLATGGDSQPPAVRPIRPKRSSPRRWRRLAHEVIDGQGGQCLICGAEGDLTCHHVVARRDGGTDVRENLIGLCASDHTTLHLVERDIPLRSRLLIAAMVVFGPSPAVCRFLRFVFPLVIRRGVGFHPAGLSLRPLRPARTMGGLA